MELGADEQVALNSKWSSDNFNESEFVHVAKGKRTRRQRQHHHTPSPQQERAVETALPTESASTSASISAAEEASAASAGSIITEEEEDMANCLILLAQGGLRNEDTTGVISQFSLISKDTAGVSAEKLGETTATISGKTGLFVYECKTCNKCFSSFQALGGHRASHKKQKLTTETSEHMKQIVEEDMLQISMNSFSKSFDNKVSSKMKPKVHECSICGSEFNSGQALGGHMRRHRPLVAAAATDHQGQQLTVNIKERSTLSLDLNLPAPTSDDCFDNSDFGFVTPWLAISN